MPNVLGVGRRPAIRNSKRQQQVEFLRRFRETTQHLSFTFRPRGVRMMWIKHGRKKGIAPFASM